ncbi:laccase, multicopper oxidase, benzenediol:oxygen oxidorectuctase [Exophiala xenobiotica]|uniref:laccase n=1 Tax=Lithohypha guttulata TaxID=1690604 RepID=A0ABR0K2E1_9EURO|nr:laccase, multicopper oxidase, benzenediol:oxygen oxidorectuctase [Lithohypha guttulata]KAK5312578.1 laccase, multicopper oxidase, benzenediol:oxygen oxidorectuctase [Exophiala xenobiotica]
MYRHSFIILFLSLIQLIHATPVPGEAQLLRIPNDPVLRRPWPPSPLPAGCVNSATNRSCWSRGYDINSNPETTWPNTGRVVRYNLEVQNSTLAPDGVSRPVYAINGQFPGPTIKANWGDTIVVTVKNSLQNNGTSMHWHGVRQWKSNAMDGTNGITECPLAPGQSRTYRFIATQYGTSWYHSHHSSQYSDGVLGPIVIDGPATANYDVDLGVLSVQDWFYETAFSNIYKLSRAIIRGNPTADNVLINGTNKNAQGGGAYHRNTIEKGKKYRLRLVNTGTNDNFKIGLDKHNMTVIAMDFVPIVPFTTEWLFIGIGERYDVIINADQPIDSYWFHVVPQIGCSNNVVANAVSIFSYKGANNTNPSNGTRNNGPPTNDCLDPNINLVPYVPLNVPSNEIIPASSNLNVNFTVLQNSTSAEQTLVQWNLNFTAIHAPWDKPTMQHVLDKNTSYPKSMNIINLPRSNQWSFWVVQAIPTRAPAQPHPMHLHGHDFYILGAGTGIFDNSRSLNYVNPPRRDVAMLPANGYMVLAFVTDNPGAWLMHCHVAWHIDLGLGAQFLERADEIPGLLDYATKRDFTQQCASWDSYDNHAVYKEEGSGL